MLGFELLSLFSVSIHHFALVNSLLGKFLYARKILPVLIILFHISIFKTKIIVTITVKIKLQVPTRLSMPHVSWSSWSPSWSWTCYWVSAAYYKWILHMWEASHSIFPLFFMFKVCLTECDNFSNVTANAPAGVLFIRTIEKWLFWQKSRKTVSLKVLK